MLDLELDQGLGNCLRHELTSWTSEDVVGDARVENAPSLGVYLALQDFML